MSSDHRKIERGSCPSCGHKPHAAPCSSTIRTRDPMPHGRDVDTPCPCPRNTPD